VWPTDTAGGSEPGEKSFVTAENRRKLLAVADETGWRSVLTLLAKLVRDKGLASVVPSIDHGRIKFFVQQWGEELEQGSGQDESSRGWLGPVLEAFGGAPLKQRAPQTAAAAAALGQTNDIEATLAAADAVSMGSVFSDFSAYLVPALLDRATNRLGILARYKRRPP